MGNIHEKKCGLKLYILYYKIFLWHVNIAFGIVCENSCFKYFIFAFLN